MTGRVLVTGGTGTTGSRVAQRLTDSMVDFAVGTRRPSADREIRFDWADPGAAEAFHGFSTAYLVAPTDRTDHLAVMRPVLEQAIAAGTRRFVLLSSSQFAAGGPMMGEVHAWLEEQAPEWAVLRPSWFMQNFSTGPHARTIREENAIYSATDNGKVGFISADDIAAAAVALLTAERIENGDTILTGPEALSYDDVAELISEVLLRRVRHVKLSPAEVAERHMRFGLPHEYASALAQLDEVIRTGAEARITDGVARWTGARATPFRSFAKCSLASWR